MNWLGTPTSAVRGFGHEVDGGATEGATRQGSVLPYHFFRNFSSNSGVLDFRNTSVPYDPSFQLLSNASFVVFDQQRGLHYLGSPTNDFVFKVSDAVHEAPVYVSTQNKLYISQLAPPTGFLPQLVVDLNPSIPTLSEYLPNPPVYAPNGGTSYGNGTLILFAASGGNSSIGDPPTEQRVSLRVLDPTTNQSTVLLNNYFGSYFNNMDDVVVHPSTGYIYFTDPYYSWYNALTDTAPQLPTASYRFDPTTGATFLIDDTLLQPNGIAISPNADTLYISDTGAVQGSADPNAAAQYRGTTFNATRPATIYAFDLANNGTKVSNKRSFYLSSSWVPDGLKVSREGLLLTGAGRGVDVIDDVGRLLFRIQTNYTVQNFAFVGEDLRELWIMGNGGISRVRGLNIQGQKLT
ncbi:gluconolactonase [Paraphaeosphaeria sporulosa]|uniref:Gluconolactonase n=1 Tax=Paraphaeosphaeria sporulosa TaxID=1460663 RepID=A0A177D101_9PLEO|nr:gluconolactonase [Paraphaeosphaeria sporulosa]OAG12852.1 gluconolactonase [Paraphaeosphaeria sporulosa]